MDRNLPLLAALLILAGPAYARDCGERADPAAAGAPRTWSADGAVGFRTRGYAVDADGSPNSYRVDGRGLSYTCDGAVAVVGGVRQNARTNKANWQRLCNEAWTTARASGDYSSLAIFGFLKGTDGKPVIQEAGDPLPGEAFITTTSLTVPGTPPRSQRHYVDATRVPYVVLTNAFARAHGIRLGDVAAVYLPGAPRIAFAAYADQGGELGEGSVRLHQDLGRDPMVARDGVARAKRGIEDKVLTVVFPGIAATASTDPEAWRAEIAKLGATALAHWGGEERLRACAAR